LDTIKQMRPLTSLPFDAHLMVDDPAFFIPQMAEAGVDYVSVHIESTPHHVDRVLSMIRDHGMKAGLAFNPGTPLDALEWLAPRLDFVLIMTVNPGFAGQKLVPTGYRENRRLPRPSQETGSGHSDSGGRQRQLRKHPEHGRRRR
jgi:ribulose-phosphate 3-epimerase